MSRGQGRTWSPHRRMPDRTAPAYDFLARGNTPKALRFVVKERQVTIEKVMSGFDLVLP